jgi:hypothetical protein
METLKRKQDKYVICTKMGGETLKQATTDNWWGQTVELTIKQRRKKTETTEYKIYRY